MNRLLVSFCATLALAAGAAAQPQFRITEAYAGISGPDGTADWIEVTNLGDIAGDTATLFYDDSSLDLGDAGQLTSFLLAPGESAVFLVGLDPVEELEELAADDPSIDLNDDAFVADFVDAFLADELADFTTIWGGGINLGLAEAPFGGGLGGGGDTAALLLGDGSIVDTLTYESAGLTATFTDPSGSLGTPAISTLGVAGARESNPFENGNLSPLDPPLITLVGSPGIAVPEPTTLMTTLAALAVVCVARRR